METFPQYDEEGQEILSFENIWRTIEPQSMTGVDCFQPTVDLRPIDNLVSLRLTDVEFREMFSALYNGAELSYPDRFMQIIVNFLRGIHCDPIVQEDECTSFPSFAHFISYAPMNPFVNPTEIPDGYTIPPFVVLNDENLAEYAGYQLDDVIAPINSFPLDTGWFDDLNENLPTIEINVVGQGTAFVKLLTQPLGGLVVITVDDPPNLIDIIAGTILGSENIIDVNKDVLSIPPESADEVIYEVELIGTGEHTIYIVFFPILDDSLIPLRFGGGFRGVDLCDLEEWPAMSCEDIENCLEASTTITNIETNITNIETNITNIEEVIAGVEDCGCGGNVYPDEPINYDEPSPDNPEYSSICNSAYAMADGLEQLFYTIWDEVEPYPEFLDWINTMLGATGVVADFLSSFWSLIVDAPDVVDLQDRMQSTVEQVAELFFCNMLSVTDTRAAIEASSMDADVIAFWLASIDMTSVSKFAAWAFVGALDSSNSCAHMCNWFVVWDFDGSYVPQDDEDAIYSGDTWDVVNGSFSEGIGYTGLTDSWHIQHALPPDCTVVSMVHSVNKNAPCSAVDISSTWRGTNGTDAVSLSPQARVLSNTPVSQNWTVFSAVLPHMQIVHDHFFCNSQYGSQSHWLRMVGTGSRPSA